MIYINKIKKNNYKIVNLRIINKIRSLYKIVNKKRKNS